MLALWIPWWAPRGWVGGTRPRGTMSSTRSLPASTRARARVPARLLHRPRTTSQGKYLEGGASLAERRPAIQPHIGQGHAHAAALVNRLTVTLAGLALAGATAVAQWADDGEAPCVAESPRHGAPPSFTLDNAIGLKKISRNSSFHQVQTLTTMSSTAGTRDPSTMFTEGGRAAAVPRSGGLQAVSPARGGADLADPAGGSDGPPAVAGLARA